MARKITKPLSSIDYLMQEWDWEKNTLNPATLGFQSNQKVWWKCKYGHSWEAKINNRYNGRGCPICRCRLKTSFQEQSFYFYIKKLFIDAINGYTAIFKTGMELDIFIPSLRMGIEYDGKAWHNEKSIQKETRKYDICKNNNIFLLRIVENSNRPKVACDYSIFVKDSKNNQYLDDAIRECLLFIFNMVNLQSNELFDNDFVNTKRDQNKIYEQYLVEFEKNSFAALFPEIAKEWNFEKNGELTPKMFSPHSSTKVWWKCDKGHEWLAAINTRTSGRGCPYCSGNFVLEGFNDLATRYPNIAEEWNYSKNGQLKPTQVTFGSGKKVWWKCNKGHEWQAAINNRTSNNRGCPYCEGEKVLEGVNDLLTVNPILASEWHPTKNGTLKPQNFRPHSNKKVWWLCPKCGYEYQSSIANRSKGTGCKNCNNQILHSGINDLQTLFPEIAKQWDYDKNGELTPNQIFPKSNKKVWWKCNKGHSWQATPGTRTRGCNCPYCSGNKVWIGFNDLLTTHSDLATEWNYSKNGELTPQKVSAGYRKKVWWKCPKCGCEYQAYISNRIKGYGCKCSGKWAQKRKNK